MLLVACLRVVGAVENTLRLEFLSMEMARLGSGTKGGTIRAVFVCGSLGAKILELLLLEYIQKSMAVAKRV